MFRSSSRLRTCSLLRDSSSPTVVRQLFGILPSASSLSPSAGRVSWFYHSASHRPGRGAEYGKGGKIISTQHGAIVLLLPAITLSYGKRYFAEEKHGGGSAQAGSSKFARWSAGAFVIPHPQKAWKGGEDAYFISENGKAVGVADGVGGWAEVGVDPSRYSKNLMAEAKKAVDELNVRDTTEILAIAAEASSHITGSSTALIVMLEGNLLLASNLGDSGVLVVRGGAVVYRSKEQQHSFNFPFQLGSESTDMPYHAERIAFPLEENDTVVVGTDGLLDNLFDQEIAEIVKRADEKSMNPQQIAKELAQQASQAANRKNGLSPFGQNALQHGYAFTGGKLDDITVVVAKPVVAS